jgi:hypothetical protein
VQRSTTHTVIAILTGALGLLVATSASAQYTADYQTNIVSGVTSNWSGNYSVGYTNNADVLVIESGGVLSNEDGYVGGPEFTTNHVLILGGGNNVAVVSGTGSVWNNSGELYVGGGAGNHRKRHWSRELAPCGTPAI